MSVHVFDLDETLFFHDSLQYNDQLLSIIQKLAEKRDNNSGVEALFLLTNNSDEEFINSVIDSINKIVYGTKNKGKKVFDYVMSRNHPERKGLSINPKKSLDDVEYMMNQIKKRLISNTQVYFYDDLKGHVLESEIPPDNFFQVKESGTDFSKLYEKGILNSRGGGRKVKPLSKRRHSFRRNKKFKTRKRTRK